MWFRLKAPGQVWVDKVLLSKVDKHTSGPALEPLIPYTRTNLRSSPVARAQRVPIFGARAKSVGAFSSGEFINFDVTNAQKGNWQDFDRIELSVFNGSNTFYDFYLTLGDDRSNNYWTQLNLKSSLAPGHNKLSFDLRQFIGERGSHRHLRSLDLRKLKKMFLVIDPDKRLPRSDKFTVADMGLVALPPPLVPPGVRAFDFTSHKSLGRTAFTKVTGQDLYDRSTGHGLVAPKFWRVEDAQYASENLRYSIGLLSGKFRIDLPNGNYKFALVWDRLGYWDPSFWRNRMVSANGVPVFKEARSQAQDYLQDLLRFEDIEPSTGDDPYDLYLSKLFPVVEKSVEVRDGNLELDFLGDATGVSLNTLVVWKVQDDKVAQGFLKSMHEREKMEFNWLSRKVTLGPVEKGVGDFELIEADLMLSPEHPKKGQEQKIELLAGAGERVSQMIQITDASNVSWKLSALRDAKGKELSADALGLHVLINQYTSADLNHETYVLLGKYLRAIKSDQMSFPYGGVRYITLTASLTDAHAPGKYEGTLTLKNGKKQKTYPVIVEVMPYKLPRANFPVGFLGLDPIPKSYFDDPGMEKLRHSYRIKALAKLGEAGFTTYTGLPSANTLSDVDTTYLDDLFRNAVKYGFDQPVFSYGGQFPNEFLDNQDQAQASGVLKKLLSKSFWPKIVHTFSDEAGGYSNKVQEDITKGKALKKNYPFLALGGFSSATDPSLRELNQIFDYGLYSHLSGFDRPPKNQAWGSYNAAPGNLDDPRFAFGPGLFLARERGLSLYLEWHLSAVNNYPYFDLDGRESDVTMFMPTSSGDLRPTLKFELATEGIQNFRKLMLLSDLLQRNEGSVQSLGAAKSWLEKLRMTNRYLEKDDFLRGRGHDAKKFRSELNQHLRNLTGMP
jgi:hypothetical protein